MFAAAFSVAALTAVFAASATHAQTLYLTSGSYTANDSTYLDIYAGRDSNDSPTDSNGDPYVATLNVVNGANIYGAFGYNTSTVNISGGSMTDAYGTDTSTVNISGGSVTYAGSAGSSTMNISGGSIGSATGFDTGTINVSGGDFYFTNSNDLSSINISGGSVTDANSYNSSTINISGGSVFRAYAHSNSTTNISGGSVSFTEGKESSSININGGTLTNGILLRDTTATVNFVGTGLSFMYQSFGNNNPFQEFSDRFAVSGTIGGATTTYDLYIRNQSGMGNSTPRQFNFVAPVVVPEAGTFALVLPALGLLSAALVRRRNAGV